MRAHYLQHVPFEGLGSIESWLKTAGYEISCTRLFMDEDLPGVADVDLLIIMGGPMSVNDEVDYPWITNEKEFIKSVIASGKPTLGICLGAQLIASALGSRVFKNPVKEIGWFPVQTVMSPDNPVFKFPDKTIVFHWHGETFNLPLKAVQIAKSEGCENQAFQLGSNVIGLQFHLETTLPSARALVENCRHELVEDRFIQTEQDILSVPEERYTAINSLMSDVLKYLHDRKEIDKRKVFFGF